MAGLLVRSSALAGAVLLACAGGEDLNGDSRGPVPITSLPMAEATTGPEASTGPGSSGGSSSGGEAMGTTTSTQLTEGTGGMCPPGTQFCPCGDGCDDGLSCVDELCQAYACGNGVVEDGELCDDGDDDESDECPAGCVPASCGDGFVHVGVEACDAGAANSDTGSCKLDCTAQACGDGFVGPGESCDDGNPVNDDACTNACAVPGCGDTMIQPPETCDDGNQDNTDACLPTCVVASCGDGFVQAGVEACDDANADNSDACIVGCVAAVCGDGFLQAGVEQCDDGNVLDGDGCTPQCQKVALLVGSYNVNSGPAWGNNPPTYTCKEACAFIFGGGAGDYACSINNVGVTGTAYLSGYADAVYCTTPNDDDFKVNSNYNCGGLGCSYSAYVADNCTQGTSINFCWKP